ncbi:regulatory protein RecX [Varibaculum vaginae]|uniref:regulatory protein RecX n=1 Tax=Varibaculum vaginae TaxID=2364797 RepID=UPI000F07AB4A|nr:regulatory protein RecX [Varibaculum vaginae]
MVKYLDPESDFSVPRRRKRNPDLAARRQKNTQLPREEALEAAREAALRVLDRAAASSGQIREKLTKAGFHSEVAEEIVTRFCEVGLLDDREYAAMLVRTRFRERGLVGRALVQELNRKGIAPNLQQEALAQITPEQEAESAQLLAEKKARSLKNATYPQAMRRIAAFLARKGYSPVQCRTATTAALADRGSETA